MTKNSCVLFCLMLITIQASASGRFRDSNEHRAITPMAGNSSFASGTTVYDTLSSPDPSPEAEALFRFLQDISGKKILSGQMWAPWGIDELNYLQCLVFQFLVFSLLTFHLNHHLILLLMFYLIKGIQRSL